MPNVSSIAPQHRQLEAPAELRALPGWLMWRLETLPGEDKARKIPYYVDGGKRHGQQGGAEDRAKLTTFAAARDAAARKGMSGVGLAMLPDWGVTALDFDHCVDANGAIPSDVSDIVCATYAEYSPSGTGIRAFVRGALGNRKSPAKGNPYGFETFSSSGFVTFTGNILPAVEVMGYEDRIAPAGPSVIALCDRRFGAHTAQDDPTDRDFMAGHEPRLGLSPERMEELLGAIDPDMGREDWVRVGMALHHETEGDDTGFALWDDWSSLSGKYPGQEALQQQWDSFTRREGSGRRQTTMASVIKMAREAASGRSGGAASVDELRAIAQAQAPSGTSSGGVQTPPDFTGKYPVLSASALSARPPAPWLIKGVLPSSPLVVLFGPSGSGKTFVAIDICAAVARGVPWREQRVVKGRVVLIAAEGGGGVGKRLAAYCQQANILTSELDIGVITAAPNFLEKDEIGEVVAAVASASDISLIVVDTFAQVTPGANENGAEDMGRALAHARALHEATGATVLLVHHAGKDAARGARGWSGIKAAADAEIEVIRHEDGLGREIRISKMKDGDDGLRWGFKLDTLVVGVDGDGDDVTSCVVTDAEVPVAPAKAGERSGVKRLGHIEGHIMEMLETFEPGEASLDLGAFIDACTAALPKAEDGKRDLRRQSVQRAITGLAAKRGGSAPFEIAHGKLVLLLPD